jgi:hypothetical protein
MNLSAFLKFLREKNKLSLSAGSLPIHLKKFEVVDWCYKYCGCKLESFGIFKHLSIWHVLTLECLALS